MAPGQARKWQEEAEEDLRAEEPIKEGTTDWEEGMPRIGLSRRVDIDTKLSIVAMPMRMKV